MILFLKVRNTHFIEWLMPIPLFADHKVTLVRHCWQGALIANPMGILLGLAAGAYLGS